MMLLAVSSGVAQTTAALGALRGSVMDSQGLPVVGAQVSYQLLVPPAFSSDGSNSAGSAGTVTADASGAFLLPALATGNYALCVTVLSLPYLDPCVWQQPATAQVSAGTTATQSIVLTKGVFLKVRVNDPAGLLPQLVDGIWTPRKLIVGVKYGNGAYQGTDNTGVDGGGRDYQLIVPVDVPFKLWLFSRDVVLKDASGAVVDTSGSMIPFQATAAQDQLFAFTVSGPAAVAQ
jgi:hypothetical protein